MTRDEFINTKIQKLKEFIPEHEDFINSTKLDRKERVKARQLLNIAQDILNQCETGTYWDKDNEYHFNLVYAKKPYNPQIIPMF